MSDPNAPSPITIAEQNHLEALRVRGRAMAKWQAAKQEHADAEQAFKQADQASQKTMATLQSLQTTADAQ